MDWWVDGRMDGRIDSSTNTRLLVYRAEQEHVYAGVFKLEDIGRPSREYHTSDASTRTYKVWVYGNMYIHVYIQ